uniref:Uncharacterized protein n=1 Tax=Opuntia streptacantha TaxID=393608 RepID=A0A7C9A0L5_OPUST
MVIHSFNVTKDNRRLSSIAEINLNLWYVLYIEIEVRSSREKLVMVAKQAEEAALKNNHCDNWILYVFPRTFLVMVCFETRGGENVLDLIDLVAALIGELALDEEG